MKRLITHGLMFGNLIEVSLPALIERYNRALKHLTGKITTLKTGAKMKEQDHVRIAG